jgi:hypothetical protein
MLESAYGDTRHRIGPFSSSVAPDHITAMRKVLTVILALSAVACGPAMRWEKPGVDDKTTADDLIGCRLAARDEVEREFPFYYPWPSYPTRHPIYWQRAELDRSYGESRLTSFCMRNKGYAQVPAAPQTQAPPPPASPEWK